MKQFFRDCRECWVTAIFIALLFVANAVHLGYSVKDHNYNLTPIIKILQYVHIL